MAIKEDCKFIEEFYHEDNSGQGVNAKVSDRIKDYRCTHEMKKDEILDCDNCKYYERKLTK